MQEMSAVGIPPSSLQGCIYNVFRNKRVILKAFYVELTLIWLSRILRMLDLIKSRRFLILVLIIITPLGFYSKFYTGPAQYWVNNSLGGVFYIVFWCLVVQILFFNVRELTIVGWVFVVTCLLETLQLWHPWFLEAIRRTFIGGTILGTTFVWSDFLYYVAGSLFGYLLLRACPKS